MTPTEFPKSPCRTAADAPAHKHIRTQMMNELERAAYQESKLLDKDVGLFTDGELAEAEALLADIDRLVDRADALNRTLMQRLSKEADGDPVKEKLLKRFHEKKGLMVKLAAF